jgi:hypothetical protein
MEIPQIIGYTVAIAAGISYIIMLCLGGSMDVTLKGRRMIITKRTPVFNKKSEYDTTIDFVELSLSLVIVKYRNKLESIFILEHLQQVNKIITTYDLIGDTFSPGYRLTSRLTDDIKSELLSYLNENGKKILSEYITNFSKSLKPSLDKLRDGL